jgi:phosphoribosylformylglycinamidine (FGAM) synthase PurS component
MKAIVTYKEDGATKQISVEAADMETVKNAVSQWKVTERRLSNRVIEIVSIN